MLRKTIPKRTRGTGSTSVSPAAFKIPVIVRNAERASPSLGSIAPSRPGFPVRTKDRQRMVTSVKGNGSGFARELKGKTSLTLFGFWQFYVSQLFGISFGGTVEGLPTE